MSKRLAETSGAAVAEALVAEELASEGVGASTGAKMMKFEAYIVFWSINSVFQPFQLKKMVLMTAVMVSRIVMTVSASVVICNVLKMSITLFLIVL